MGVSLALLLLLGDAPANPLSSCLAPATRKVLFDLRALPCARLELLPPFRSEEKGRTMAQQQHGLCRRLVRQVERVGDPVVFESWREGGIEEGEVKIEGERVVERRLVEGRGSAPGELLGGGVCDTAAGRLDPGSRSRRHHQTHVCGRWAMTMRRRRGEEGGTPMTASLGRSTRGSAWFQRTLRSL